MSTRPYKPVCINIDIETLTKIDTAKGVLQLSRNQIVRRCLANELDNLITEAMIAEQSRKARQIAAA